MEKLKKIGISVIIFVATSLILFAIMVGTCCIPREALTENVKKSSKTFKEESWLRYIGNILTDNYTEELMVNMSYSVDNKHPIESVILARRNYVPGITTNVEHESYRELKLGTEYIGNGQEETEVEAMLRGKNIDSYLYTRYWHGYISIIRPLLVFLDIKQIRCIFNAVLILTAGIMLILLKKRCNLKVVIVYLLSLISVDYFIMGINLQGTLCLLIGMAFSIILLAIKNKSKYIKCNLFMIVRNVNLLF